MWMGTEKTLVQVRIRYPECLLPAIHSLRYEVLCNTELICHNSGVLTQPHQQIGTRAMDPYGGSRQLKSFENIIRHLEESLLCILAEYYGMVGHKRFNNAVEAAH